MLTSGSVLDLTFSYLYYLWCPETKKLPLGAEIFNSGQRNLWKIYYHIKYKINQTETDTTDVSYSHKYNFKWPTPYSPGTGNTFHSISGYGHFLPYENDDHFCPRIYSGCFTCLILIRLYINPTCYNLSFQFCIRKD